ncbi:MAG: SO_0444 family Cu/Zn efflux transporter [Victivallaceae bacterium]
MLKLLLQFLNEFWIITCQMAPWLLFGFLIAGLLSVFFSEAYVKKHLGKKGLKSIIKAALIGVPLPLCSCGVIPVTAALRKQGAGRGAAGSFLISTPQTGVDSFLVTYSMLGWFFAIFRPVFAFITGIIGGLLIEKFGEQDEPEAEIEHANAGCCDISPSKKRSFPEILLKTFHYGFVVLLGDIALSLLIGLLAAAIISMAVPDNYAADSIGKSWMAMPLMMLIGIPMYVCSTASVPIAAALIIKGFSPGAALVFMITGPATNAATISAMWHVLGKRSTMIYLTVLAVCSMLAGLLLDFMLSSISGGSPMCHINSAPGIFQKLSAAALLAMIAFAVIRRRIKHSEFKSRVPVAETPEIITIRISGMTCSHCLDAAREAILNLPDVQDADIDLATGRAVIRLKSVNDIYPAIERALQISGFSSNKE